jgi:hypothetical protein
VSDEPCPLSDDEINEALEIAERHIQEDILMKLLTPTVRPWTVEALIRDIGNWTMTTDALTTLRRAGLVVAEDSSSFQHGQPFTSISFGYS